MTQQADRTYRPIDADRAPLYPGTIPTQRGHAAADGATPPAGFGPVPPAGLGVSYPYPAPYGAPMQAPAPMPPARKSSTGKVLGIVGAVVGAVVVVVVLAVVLLGAALGASSTAAPAPPAPRPAPAVSAPAAPGTSAAPAPSSAAPLPADRAVDRNEVQQEFDAAGVRLDQARSTFDSAMQSAADHGDATAFRAAADHFRQELETYRATVGGLAMPADQQQAVTGTLLPAVDAAVADCGAMSSSSGQSGLKAAAKQFDADWSTVVDTHNQIDQALAQG